MSNQACVRVRIGSPTGRPDEELPFRILVIADVLGRAGGRPLGERVTVPVGPGTMAALQPHLAIPEECGGGWLQMRGWEDWSVTGVVRRVLGLHGLEGERLKLLRAAADPDQRLGKDVAAALLAERIERLAQGLLGRSDWRRLEAAWRSLDLLGEPSRPGVEVRVLPATREEIVADLDEAPEPSASGLHRTIYSAEFGQHGGRPWSVIVLDLELGPGVADVALLRRFAAIAAAAHAPVLVAAGPRLLGLDSWGAVAAMREVAAVIEAPACRAWRALRERDEARQVAIALPAVVLRGPLGDGDHALLGGAAHAVAARLAACHALTGWCAGAASGRGEDALGFTGPPRMVVAALLPEDLAAELAAQGIIPLCGQRRSTGVVFPHLPTLRAGVPGSGPAEQLPLVLLGSRIAHHLKVLQRERLGGNLAVDDLERGLNRWLDGLCADGQVADPELRARRPLRQARVAVSDVPGRAGWLRADLSVRPHLPGCAAEVVLDLVGRLDREVG
jgi:type VI secretion system protein ImpC